MSDIRYNGWLHRSGTGGVWQDSSGRVGIGSSVPTKLLELKGTDPTIKLWDSSGDAYALVECDSADQGSIRFRADPTSAGGSTHIRFDVDGAEGLRINSTGQLIIGGDVTPYATRSATFQPPASQTNSYISIIAGNTSSVSALTFGDAAGQAAGNYAGMFEYYHSDDSLRYAQNASEKLRIDSSGRLLIGTTTEGNVGADDLTIYGSGDCGITIRSGASSEGSIMFSDGTSGGDEYRGWINYNQNSNFLRFFTNASERLRLTASGELLLGTTTAQGNANANDLVVATTGTTGITIRSGTSNNGNLFFADGTSSSDEYRGFLSYDHSTDNLTLGTSAGERIRITNVGQVLINTSTAPAFSNRQFAVSSTSGTTAIEIRSATNGDGRIIFTDSTNSGDTGSYKGQIMYDQTNDYMQFQTNGSNERFRITDNGVTFKGDSAAANALDDYEEGSWTPAPDDLTNTPQYHNKVGIYTKIGNLVYVMGFIQFGNSPAPTFSNTSNQLYVSGLPFPCNAGAGYVSAVGHVTYQSMNWSGGTYNDYGADVKLICTATSSSKVQFRVDGGNNTIRGTLRKAAWHNGTFIVTWSMWYRTTS